MKKCVLRDAKMGGAQFDYAAVLVAGDAGPALAGAGGEVPALKANPLEVGKGLRQQLQRRHCTAPANS